MRRIASTLLVLVLSAAAPCAAFPSGAPGASGHAGTERLDQALPSAEVPVASVVAKVVNEHGAPIAGAKVVLVSASESVARGTDRAELMAKSDAQGIASWSGLGTGAVERYMVRSSRDSVDYASVPFELTKEMGHKVLLHLFPATDDIEQTLLALRAFVYVEPRDDVFQFNVQYRAFNMGTTSYLPSRLALALPQGAKAFSGHEGAVRAVTDGSIVRFSGAFTPGQHDLSFRFQVPNDNDATAAFRMDLPPRVAEVQLVAETASTMSLVAEGFGPATPSTNQNGQRVQVLTRRGQVEAPLKELRFELRGVPVQGPGRWISGFVASLLVVSGLIVAARRKGKRSEVESEQRERARAEALIFDELVALERAYRKDQIGPKTHEQAREVLLSALVELGRAGSPTTARRRSPRAAGRNRA
jgi:hypothetical protein